MELLNRLIKENPVKVATVPIRNSPNSFAFSNQNREKGEPWGDLYRLSVTIGAEFVIDEHLNTPEQHSFHLNRALSSIQQMVYGEIADELFKILSLVKRASNRISSFDTYQDHKDIMEEISKLIDTLTK